jgi:hypothetical protein
MLIPVLLLLGGGYLWWNNHTKSPEYRAGQQLAEADRLAKRGDVDEAAKLYRSVGEGTSPRAEEGVGKFSDLLGEPLDGAPLEKSLVVMQIAAGWDEHAELRDGLADRALELARARGDDDPHAGIATLDLVSQLDGGVQKHGKVLDELLKRWADKHPDDPAVVTAYCIPLHDKGQLEECEKRLAPLRDKLALSEGAVVLASARTASGNLADADALLGPVLDRYLPAWETDSANLRAVQGKVQEELIKKIDAGIAPAFRYKQYREEADPQKKEWIRREYLARALSENPDFRQAQQRVGTHLRAALAARALGTAHLTRARMSAVPAEREAESKKAERLLAELARRSGNSPELVNLLVLLPYWMGDAKEGNTRLQKLLDDERRSTDVLLRGADLLGQVKELAGAAKLLDEAYAQEKDPVRREVLAFQRSRITPDVVERIAWLGKSSKTEPQVLANLALDLAELALERGRAKEAEGHLRRVLKLFEGAKDNPYMLNECGLTWLLLFRATGEKAALTKGLEVLDEARKLAPQDPRFIYRAADKLQEAALRDVVIDSIDLLALRSPLAQRDHLAFLYSDRAGRDDLYQKLLAHPATKRVRELAYKMLALDPRSPAGYHILSGLHLLARDVESLKVLDNRLRLSGVNLSDSIQAQLDRLAGSADARLRQEQKLLLERSEKRLKDIRSNKPGRTFAVAAARVERARLMSEALGDPTDGDSLVRLAEEALKASDSRGTRDTLVNALLHRAHKRLTDKQPAYAALAKRCRYALDSAHLIAFALSEGAPELQQAVKNDPDVKRTCGLLKEAALAFPDEPSPWVWAMLKATHPDAASKQAEALKTDDLSRMMRSITLQLSPLDMAAALEEYWALKVAGREAEGRKLLTSLGERGVPSPFEADLLPAPRR